MRKLTGQYEIKKIIQGMTHFANVELTIEILSFDLSRQDIPSEVVYRKEDLIGFHNRVFRLVKDGVQIALTLWNENNFPHPQQLQISIIKVNENPALGSDDDVRIASAMAFLEALNEATQNVEQVNKKSLNTFMQNLKINYLSNGKLILNVNTNN